MPANRHPDADVDAAFRRLQRALVEWERATGRESVLIFREVQGSVARFGAMPSDVVIRL